MAYVPSTFLATTCLIFVGQLAVVQGFTVSKLGQTVA